LKTLAFLIALVPIMAFADPGKELATVALPNVTQDTIVGTWEAVVPTEISGISRGLYRVEITKERNLYLVGVAFELGKTGVDLVARGSDLQVSSGDVTLRFKTVQADEDTKAEEIIFKGSGVCEGEVGAMHGALSISGKPLGGFTGEIWFHKGSWTRDFQKASKEGEKRIQQLRANPKT
jgi:hypothetical protein